MEIIWIVGIVLLILVIASKTMDIIIGLLGIIAGVGGYIWLSSTDSIGTQLQLLFQYGLNPLDLKNYAMILAGVSLVILIIGLVRGRKPQQIVVVQQQVPMQTPNPQSVQPKADESAKTVEPKKEDVIKEENKN